MIDKLKKSELVVALAAFLAMVIAPKLGMPEEKLAEMLQWIAGVAMTYIAGRAYAKPRESAASGPSVAGESKPPA